MNPTKTTLVATFCLLAIACSGDDVHVQHDADTTATDIDANHDVTSNTSMGPDAGTDASQDASTGPHDAGIQPDASEAGGPLTECVDGVLVATETSCGVCGLGALECAPGTTGAATCVGPSSVELGFDDDGVVDCGAQLVYLDPNAVPGGSGEVFDPMADLERAYALARARARKGAKEGRGPTLLVMAQGTLEHAGPILLGERVSMVGGFSRSNASDWTYDPSGKRRTQIRITRGPRDVTMLGMFARGLTGRTVVSHVDLVVDDGLDFDEVPKVSIPYSYSGGSSVGLWALDTSGLTLRHMRIEAGAGGQGAHGRPGGDGQPGAPGRHGTYGSNQGVLTHPTPPEGVLGGSNPLCDARHGTPDGGHGGRSGGACAAGMTDSCHFFEATWPDALMPESGAHAPGLRGGMGGDPVADGFHYYHPMTPVAATDGAPGQPGSPGADGQGGVTGGISRDDVIWDPRGASGGRGAPGQNGGGGGGGGAIEYLVFGELDWFYGPGGASGGAGGCGGQGGQGGQEGGGSVGARLVRSPITLEHVVLKASAGGAGGDGGAGGIGAEGGAGGHGTSMLWRYADSGRSGFATPRDGFARSGDGGAGARGGDGGHGGGGAGGDSIGLYCLDSPGLTLTDVITLTAPSSRGGRGPGVPGQPGLSQPTTGCP